MKKKTSRKWKTYEVTYVPYCGSETVKIKARNENHVYDVMQKFDPAEIEFIKQVNK